MKKVLGILLVLGLFCSTASAVSLVSLGLYATDGTSTTINCQVGDTIQVAVFVQDVSMMAGWGVYLNEYGLADIGVPGSGTVLERVALASVGTWAAANANDAGHAGLNPDSAKVTLWEVTAMLNATITEDPVYGPLPEDEWLLGYLDGSGDIAIFTFKAGAVGTLDLVLDAENTTLGADDASNIPYDLTNGTVTVNVIPEPLTMTLLASGLLGLVAYRRRK
jgi:hypothetical protein